MIPLDAKQFIAMSGSNGGIMQPDAGGTVDIFKPHNLILS